MSERTDPSPEAPRGDADLPEAPPAEAQPAETQPRSEAAPIAAIAPIGGAAPTADAAPATEAAVADQVGDAADPLPVAADQPIDAPLPPRRFWLLAVIALVVYVLDQLTKIIAVANLTSGGESPRILGGLIYFSLIRNPGAAFSMATGMTWVLAIIAVIVVVVIIRIAARLRSVWWAVSLGLILGGALGNLTDRIFRSPGFFRGHVVDFVSVFGPNAEHFPIFNVADSAITVGGILLVVTALQGIEFDGSRAPHKTKAERQVAGPVADRKPSDRTPSDRNVTDG